MKDHVERQDTNLEERAASGSSISRLVPFPGACPPLERPILPDSMVLPMAKITSYEFEDFGPHWGLH
jgi:hypothetical protein